MATDSSLALSQSDQENLLEELGIFKIQGRDKGGRKVLLITGKHFPGKDNMQFTLGIFWDLFFSFCCKSNLFCGVLAREVSGEVLKKYLEEKIYPKLEEKAFSVVYVHTDVQRSENFPGISTLRSIYDDIPMNVKSHLESVYFLHPGLQARLFLATFGRFLFSGG